MEIRCKRCFKRYDYHEDSCPRCGKLNEFEDRIIHEKDYEDIVREVEPIEPVDHYEVKEKKKGSFQCAFCGETILNNLVPCKICGNRNHVSKKEDIETNSVQRLEMVLEEIFEKNSVLDQEKLKSIFDNEHIVLDKWQAPYDYKVGKRMNIKQIGLFVLPIMFLKIDSFFARDIKLILIFFTIAFIGAIILSTVFRNKMLIEYITFGKHRGKEYSSLSYTNKKSKSKNKPLYSIKSNELEKIEVNLDSSRYNIGRIKLHAKPEVDVKDLIYEIDLTDFVLGRNFNKLILMFAYKYGITIEIT